MKAFFASFFGVIAAILVVVIVVIVGIASLESDPPEISSGTTLIIELEGEISDQPSASSTILLDEFLDQPKALSFSEILLALDAASRDSRVKDVRIELGVNDLGYGRIQEMRHAIEQLEAEGKEVSVYAKVYTQKMIYLARSASQVFIAPGGYVEFSGLSTAPFYLKGALDNVGIQAHLVRGSDNIYKSAGEPFIAEEMSDANRAQIQERLNAIFNGILGDLSIDGMDTSRLQERMRINPLFRAQDALDYGFVNALSYGWPDEASLEMDLADYWEGYEKPSGVKKVAVIVAEGDIQDGSGSDGVVADETIVKVIHEIAEDKRIGAVVLRVNSPGGSALASDIIWQAVKNLAEIKPVVVSMGDVAASGGYYIAAPGQEIYANPASITGSIGVFGLLFTAEELFHDKMGIQSQPVGTHPLALSLTLDQELDPALLEILQDNVDITYDRFKEVVAEGRNLPQALVDSISRGHVYAGSDAIELGLVDHYGGLIPAIERAEELAGYRSRAHVVFYPERPDPLESLVRLARAESQFAAVQSPSNAIPWMLELLNQWSQLETYQGVQMRELLFKL